ncbi:RidA family protein [Paraburkholderia caballeronis]|uniref:Enamine deaminase RidA, house cleaning of reactive enamine intermediates, YjgF/YER057c/UK114 family n=1 Tax=Paraburkholderia caballeronis TaxID=416943 RepID=A0A1H7S5M8_9BURK|nr:RidA family protein [Paraburkholderia caballeronis]PXW22890.1 enamine deaminase RidA (YjgF/YER057c/UK114 family) [Paraburkholderia caballeronis]PXW97275.1 enamine deaminase RidA (YjgF/YER057c/UK114 family) [Paraburkholderia caballeronis]RAJ93795.1 enamine deaminase RidA (YjgF/YER057c/UK114 family) [Paraburkholderia caballeronis]TDV13942.1 enamine deaminase RidA (YjgF/YER057c/UK114 family) [Paraburkholderia caballeronis]TDV15455.1 enamine deaminase RidA (YjgF/YER057c/UK114 family) [Paraburkh
MHPDEAFLNLAREHSFPVDEEIKVGGKYAPIVIDGGHAYISGQIPRIGDRVHYVGVVGADLSLDDARRAATVSTLRALALVRGTLGTLAGVVSAPRITVFVRSAPDFTQQSEVADGASEALYAVLGPIGIHTRTSVGVLQLPKGAAVEIDFVFGIGSNH